MMSCQTPIVITMLDMSEAVIVVIFLFAVVCCLLLVVMWNGTV